MFGEIVSQVAPGFPDQKGFSWCGTFSSRLGRSETLFSVFEHGRDLFARDAREPFQELIDGRARLKILEQSPHRHTRTFENPSAAELILVTFYFRAIGPIQHGEHDMLPHFRGARVSRGTLLADKIEFCCTVNIQPRTLCVYPMERLLDVAKLPT